MKANQPQATTIPRYSSLQISTTPRGRAVPIIYGTNKINSDIIWAGDFHVVKYENSSDSSAGGGKGGGGGGGGGGKGGGGQGTTEFFYFAAFMGAICEGPIGWHIAARSGSQWIYFNAQLDPKCWPVIQDAKRGQTNDISGGAYEGYPLIAYLGGAGQLYNTHLPYQLQQNDLESFARYEAQGMIDSAGNISPVSNSGFIWNGTHFDQTTPLSWASQPIQLCQGNQVQPPPPYLTQRHPEAAFSYPNTAYWFSPNWQLGQSPTPPSTEWFIAGLMCYDLSGATTGGIPIFDANPADVIGDLFTESQHGLGFSSSYLDNSGTMGQFRQYCTAAGLFISVVISGQQDIAQIAQQICDQTIAACWWSEGKVKITPWFDLPVTGYGQTFTPNMTPVYSIGDDHLIDSGNTGGLEITRSAQADSYNQLSLNFGNRYLNYSTDTVTVDDLGDQILHGVRPAPPASAQFIADPSVAFVSARLQLQKQLYSRMTYSFSLPYVFCLLEPMDIIQLTDTFAGVVARPVRIQQVQLQSNGSINVTAQDIPNEVYNLAAYNQQASLASGLAVSGPPGSVTAPVIFTGPSRLTGQSLEAWIAVNGNGPAWGGCRVWVSLDDAHYSTVMPFWGGSRYGHLINNLPAYSGAEPDNGNVLMVNLQGVNEQLNSVSAAQAAQQTTLSLILGLNVELLSYTTAAGTGNANYSLSGLYRSLAGTVGTLHEYGDPFVRLDGNLIKVPFDSSMLDQTVYFKFTSFNQVGALEENLANVASYTYTLGFGVSTPFGPSNLVVGSDGKLIFFTWQQDQSPEVNGYEIRFGPIGSTWDTATVLLSGVSASHTASGIAPPGRWTFFVRSFDSQGKWSVSEATEDFTVPNLYTLVEGSFGAVIHSLDAGAYQYSDWGVGRGATLTNCAVHPTGWELVPTDTALASFVPPGGTGWEWVDDFAVAPPPTSSWTSPVLDSLGNGLPVRCSAAAFPYLWSLVQDTYNGIPIPFPAYPNWSGWTLSGALIHPTAYAIVPDSSVLASFVPSGGTGWEMFDNFVYSPVSSPSATSSLDAGALLPLQISFSSTIRAGVGQSASPIPSTLTVSYSTDNLTWKTISSPQGTATTFAIARYIKVQTTIPTSPCVEYLQNIQGQLLAGPGKYWTQTPVFFSDSPDATTWSTWKQLPSTYTSDRYVRFQVSWPNTGTPWPVAMASLWFELDMPQVPQRGSAAVPAAGLTITYNPAFRQSVTPTVSILGTGAALAIVTSSTLTGFTAQCFTTAGTPVGSNITWTAIGA